MVQPELPALRPDREEPAMTEPNQQLVEAVVAANIDQWGWGPLDEIEGLAEHQLALDACRAGYLAAIQATDGECQRLRSALGDAVAFVRDLARTDTLIMADTLENRADGWEAALKEQSK
jgi:hypothetical protein